MFRNDTNITYSVIQIFKYTSYVLHAKKSYLI